MDTLGTWFVSEICVWIPCIKETMMMIIIIIIIIILATLYCLTWDKFNDGQCSLL
jgi:hypothetical protein